MTNQEKLWAGDFGKQYHERIKQNINSDIALFDMCVGVRTDIDSIIEFGCGSGNNIKALKYIFEDAEFSGVEINKDILKTCPEYMTKHNASILDFCMDTKHDLVLTKGLLIHIHPIDLEQAFKTIYNAANKYMLMCEYYSPVITEIKYRGQNELMWKGDYSGLFMDQFKDVQLIDYGFQYHLDPYPQDDINWFLMKKV
jgi:pseudaminic acid biosynthesis-associated methylase